MRYFRIFSIDHLYSVQLLGGHGCKKHQFLNLQKELRHTLVALCFLIIAYFYAGLKFILLGLRAEETVTLNLSVHFPFSGTSKNHVGYFL